MWYNFLDAMVMPKNPKANRAVVLKMLADQLIWAPFFSCVFFTFIYALQVAWLSSSATATRLCMCLVLTMILMLLLQARPDLIIPTIQRKLMPMLLANYALW